MLYISRIELEVFLDSFSGDAFESRNVEFLFFEFFHICSFWLVIWLVRLLYLYYFLITSCAFLYLVYEMLGV